MLLIIALDLGDEYRIEAVVTKSLDQPGHPIVVKLPVAPKRKHNAIACVGLAGDPECKVWTSVNNCAEHPGGLEIAGCEHHTQSCGSQLNALPQRSCSTN